MKKQANYRVVCEVALFLEVEILWQCPVAVYANTMQSFTPLNYIFSCLSPVFCQETVYVVVFSGAPLTIVVME